MDKNGTKDNFSITAMMLVFDFIFLQTIFPVRQVPFIYWGIICMNAFAVFLILYQAAIHAGKFKFMQEKPEHEKTTSYKLYETGISIFVVFKIVPRIFGEMSYNLFYILLIVYCLIGILLLG